MHSSHTLALAAIFALGAPVLAQHGPPADLTTLSRGADRVVVARVMHVDPVYQTNEFGDRLIISRTRLHIDAVLKGGRDADGDSVILELEGGTIGDITLDVSDLPTLERGERAVVFLRKNGRGAVVPHGRGEGILKLDSSDRVKGKPLTLSAVRQAVERAR